MINNQGNNSLDSTQPFFFFALCVYSHNESMIKPKIVSLPPHHELRNFGRILTHAFLNEFLNTEMSLNATIAESVVCIFITIICHLEESIMSHTRYHHHALHLTYSIKGIVHSKSKFHPFSTTPNFTRGFT